MSRFVRISRWQQALGSQGLILAAIFSALNAGVASGQTSCGAWTNPLIYWRGTYNLTLTGSGTAPCGGAYQVTNSSQGGFDATNIFAGLGYGFSQGSARVDERLTNCENYSSVTAFGSGPLLWPDGTRVEILLDLTNCAYTVLIDDTVDVSKTLCDPLGCVTDPTYTEASEKGADGVSGTPPYVPLPPFGEPLVVSTNYSASVSMLPLGQIVPCTITISWNIQASLASPPPPTLTAALVSGNIVLSWPGIAAGFTLQATTNLSPPIAWTIDTNSPSFIADSYYVTNRLDGPARFYRLLK